MSVSTSSLLWSVNLKQQLHAISVNQQQTVFAVACKNDVAMIKLREDGLSAAGAIPVIPSSKNADSFVLVMPICVRRNISVDLIYFSVDRSSVGPRYEPPYCCVGDKRRYRRTKCAETSR